MSPGTTPAPAVAAARALCARCDWDAAREQLRAADAQGQLDGEGLELLADCARWAGQHDEVVEVLERAYRAYGDDARGAARAALALSHAHMDACRPALAAGWWRRADELIASLPEGPEHGLHAWFAGRAAGDQGDVDAHDAHARRALEISRRFQDRNVEALALIDLAHVATVRGRTREALDLLDRATALALGGEIGILETGMVFCNAIYACRSRGDWDRAQQWTESSTRWVSRVQVSYFPGLCRVHRAEVLRIRGELAAAESEALEAHRLLGAAIPRWIAMAHVELGEVRRRRGNLAGAMAAYRDTIAAGGDPQPGLALTMVAQGDADGAHRALERHARTRLPTLFCEDRTGLLRARTTVALAAGERDVAAALVDELAAIAAGESIPWDRAAAAQARGELALARQDLAAAADSLYEARALWAELEAPYELAVCCRWLGRALAASGDALGAALEIEAARGIFDRIGAGLDRDACDALLAAAASGGAAPRPATRGAADARLAREGDVWSLAFEDVTLRVKDGRGPQYLARLLAEPGRELLALDLAGDGQVAPGGDAGDVLDGQARGQYRARIAELREELDEARRHHDLGRIERCEAELDEVGSALIAAVGLGGRARRAGDAGERARQSVTKALRTTIRRLADEHEPLGRYLSNTIRTGLTCRFDPDPGRPVRWHVVA